MTQGHEPQWQAETLRSKEVEIEKVTTAYGFERVFRLGLPTVRMDQVALEDVIRGIRDATDEARPDCVYLNHAGDVHSDHRVTFEATMSALKPFYSSKHGVRRVLSYETLSSTDAMPPSAGRSFSPTVFTDITPFVERKLEIMSLYSTEVQSYPLPRALESIRALARLRGSTVGVAYAEAFMLIREVN
jgi:LmbE family N-acetylglucosaminyl deacetylase